LGTGNEFKQNNYTNSFIGLLRSVDTDFR